MRRIRPELVMTAARGVTLIEMVVAIVLIAIIAGVTIYFAAPVRQAVDAPIRADLTDVADNALQRISREVRLALPNSVRVPAACSPQCIELIPVRTAGRYRADPTPAGCDQAGDAGGSDELAFDIADSCFKSIGTVPNANTIVADPLTPGSNDFLVLNNYGSGFAGQDAYVEPGVNRARLVRADEQGGVRERINFTPTTFTRTQHDSPGRRFYVVTTPVTFVCDLGARTLRRHSGYTYAQTYADVAGVLVANDVANCDFDYVANVAIQTGLLTLRLTLSRAVSSGQQETVTLFNAVHVNNVP
jgi:MSHA biogenesis protein MshO